MKSTYTKEHGDNGCFILWALKFLEEGETDKAKDFLRNQVTTKVFIVESVCLSTRSQREL
jgi:hypothetical protein